MLTTKRGRIWLTGEDFFASSPAANLAGINEEGHDIVFERL